MKILSIKEFIIAAFGVIGSAIASFFGGWAEAMTTLIIFMIIDYVTGIVTAGVFKKSTKTDTGALESRAGLKGIFRKIGMLCIVAVAFRIDLTMNTGGTFLRDAVIITLCVNEGISIIENIGLMGVPIPKVLKNAIDVLKKKSEKEDNEDKEE